MKPATARLSKACSSATSASKKSSKIKGFQGNHSEKGGSLFYFSAISLLVWTLFHPSSMSFLCRAQTTMSCYVTNFESLLLKEFSSNGMTKPLNAIIGVANFSVNFPLQRKESQLTATLLDLHIFFRQQPASLSYHLQLTEDFQLSPCSSDQTPSHRTED